MTVTIKEVAAKASVAFVAAAMAFSLVAPAAQAQTTEDLQQMINDLLAQVATLQSQLGQDGGSTGGSMAPGVCPYTWTRDLSQGDTGMDVMKLQQFLNSDPDTRVAAAGMVGSAGMETEYYGPATAAAVSKMQSKYRAEILAPLGLVNPTGYFGAGSRTVANDMCVTPTTTPTPDDGDDEEEMDDEDGMEDEDEDEDEDMELSGSADLQTFEVDDASETDVQEGASDVEIGVFTVEFDNGDAEISRLDIALEVASGNDGDDDPWDVFETISLWVDGDMIAEVNADDEDDYLDEDDGSLRFSDLDLIAMEDEEVEITVGASIQNNLDGVANGEDWMLYALEMRFFDADGVATTDDGTGDLDDQKNGQSADFTIEEEGEGEELNFSLAASSPDATDIIVDEDNTTDGVTIMTYEIEAEGNDIELDFLVVRIETDGVSTTQVVDDAYLVLDGQTFKAENIGGTPGASGDVDSNTSVFDNGDEQGVWYAFDIDGEVTIEEDEEMEVDVVVDFRSTDEGNDYTNGQTIRASVGNAERGLTEAEGADDLGSADFSGTATGDEHILVAEGIVLPVDGVDTTTDTSGENDTIGEFTIEFEVTAVEGDFYITDDVEDSSGFATTGVKFEVDAPAGYATSATSTATGVLTSTADEDTDGVFTVREGQTETFTLTVTIDTNVGGQHRVTLTEVNYTDSATGVGGTFDSYTPNPLQDFRTGFTNINANTN